MAGSSGCLTDEQTWSQATRMVSTTCSSVTCATTPPSASASTGRRQRQWRKPRSVDQRRRSIRRVRSDASDLVSGDDGEHPDVYVRDLVTDTTTRVSVTPSGGNPCCSSLWPAISGDGRFVSFHSRNPARSRIGVLRARSRHGHVRADRRSAGRSLPKRRLQQRAVVHQCRRTIRRVRHELFEPGDGRRRRVCRHVPA